MRHLRTTLLASVVAATTAAPGFSEQMTFAGWTGLYGFSAPIVEKMRTDFEESHAGVDFVVQDVPFEKALDQATVAHLGKNSADVIQLIPGWVPALHGIGALSPLDDLFSEEELSQIPKAALDALRFEDGKLYALPWAPGPVMLFYNRNLLEKAGFDPDTPPKTWDEVTTMIKGVCALPEGDEGKTYGLALRSWANPNAVQWTIPLIYGYGGGDVVDAEGNIKFNTEATRKTYSWLQDIVTSGCAPEGFSVGETRNLMAAGRAGFILEGPWGRSLFSNLSQNTLKTTSDGDIWVMPFPPAEDGTHRTIGNSHVLTISSQSENKEHAADFIRHVLFDQELTDAYFQAVDQLGTPSLPLLSQGPMAEDEFTQIFVNELNFYNDSPIKHPKFYAILDKVVPEFQRILGGADAETSLEAADKQIQRLLSR